MARRSTARLRPAGADLAWGGLSGVGTGLGMMFLFRGISRGAMSIVVPLSAVGGTVLPILVGVAAFGERPAAAGWAGIALAVPALWAVSRGPAVDGHRPRAPVGDGVFSGAGIALQYLALARAGPESGIWPVVAGRVTAIVTVAVLATVLPTVLAGPDESAGGARVDLPAAAAGALAGVALVCYLLATRTELVAVAVVLSSLYPVVPVLLGITVLRERLTTLQTCGLVAALAASVVIATA